MSLLPRKSRERVKNGHILRLGQALHRYPDAGYQVFAAAYGIANEGPWGLPGDSLIAFGDEVVEHMISEGASFDEIVEVGRACLSALQARIPKQSEVDAEVGNS
jgi:hypothetical protein